MYETGFPEWDEKYRVLCLLRESEGKKTYLLEERDGVARKVCKVASCGQAVFLQQEYEMLKKYSNVWKFETLEFRENGETCAVLRDYLPGRTLAELVEREGVMEAEDAARLGIRLCRILRVLHGEEPPVIHRDLKPENILVTESGRLRLIDFETARLYKSGQETDTVRLGTRGYAAPEQFGHGQTDARTDIYAVGGLLLYMTAGDCEAEPSAANRREKEFAGIVRKCRAYEPGRRYSDIGELEKALQAFLEGRSRPLRGSRMTAVLAVVLALCLISGLAGAQLARRQGAGPKQSAATDEPVWHPAVYKDYVNEIVRYLQDDNYEKMAAACETLVGDLQESEALREVEPVDYWELDEDGLNEYYTERLGFEFIADHLAYGDGLAAARLGTYGDCADSLAIGLRTRIDYTWTNDDGTLASSALHEYVVLGDDRNIDGCIIEILDEICKALEESSKQEETVQLCTPNDFFALLYCL